MDTSKEQRSTTQEVFSLSCFLLVHHQLDSTELLLLAAALGVDAGSVQRGQKMMHMMHAGFL